MLCLQTILEIPGKRRQVLEHGDRWSVSSGDTLVFGNARCQVDIGPAADRGAQVLFRAAVAIPSKNQAMLSLAPLINAMISLICQKTSFVCQNCTSHHFFPASVGREVKLSVATSAFTEDAEH